MVMMGFSLNPIFIHQKSSLIKSRNSLRFTCRTTPISCLSYIGSLSIYWNFIFAPSSKLITYKTPSCVTFSQDSGTSNLSSDHNKVLIRLIPIIITFFFNMFITPVHVCEKSQFVFIVFYNVKLETRLMEFLRKVPFASSKH